MGLFTSDKARIQRLENLLQEARNFIGERGVYYYNDNMRGPASNLARRIDEELNDKRFFGDL